MTQAVKKLFKDKLWALVLVIAIIVCAIPAHQVFGDAKQKPTEAVFYVLKREYERPLGVKSERQAKYEKVGTGTIAQMINISEDDDAVANNIVNEPDASSILNEGEKIVWYVCKKETDGWHIDGEIVKITDDDQTVKDDVVNATTEAVTEKVTEKQTEKVTESVAQETTTEKPVETTQTPTQSQETTTAKKTTTAHFAVLKSGYTRPTTTKSEATAKYSKVGDGKIYDAVKIENDDEKVKANIAVEPDMDKYLADDEEVVWYVCKKEADGWHIDGEIVKVEDETEPSGETTAPPKEPKPEKPTLGVNENKTTEAVTESKTENKTTEAVTESKTENKTTEAVTESKTENKTTEAVTESKTENKTTEAVTESKTENKTTEAVTESKTEEKTTEAKTESKTEEQTTQANKDNNTSTSSSIRDELKQMILTGDMTTHNVSKYGLTYRQIDDIWEDLAKNECYLAVHTYYGAFLSTTKDSNGKILTIKIYNADENFRARYAILKSKVSRALSGLDSRMSDLEKALYLYDFLMDNTYYKMVGIKTYYSGSILGDGFGVCSGYADAYMVLLHEAGIDATVQSGQGINHAWSYIKIGGQWYHADPTWDDLDNSNICRHTYFMRNDTEYKSTLPKSHKAWYCSKIKDKSTSTKYTNWFVHDVIGKLYYSNTFWYYYDKPTNSIKSAKIDGSSMTTVIDGNAIKEKVSIVSVNKGVLTYKIGNTTYTKTVK